MKVSVIVPIFNIEPWIGQCAESLLSQSGEPDLEYIFVDDNSSDSSLLRLREVCERRPHLQDKITIIALPENLGTSGARRKGLLAATGDYVSFIDGEDIVSPELYQRAISALAQTDADVLSFGVCNLYQDGHDNIEIPGSYTDADQFLRALLVGDELPYLSNKLIRRDLFAKSGAYAPREVVAWEDKLICCQIATAAQKVASIHEVFYTYRRNLPGKASAAAWEFRTRSMIKAANLIANYFIEHNLYDKYRRELDIMRLKLKLFLMRATRGSLQKEFSSLYVEIDPQVLDATDVGHLWRFALASVRMGSLGTFRLINHVSRLANPKRNFQIKR